jgi:hypothetical protein
MTAPHRLAMPSIALVATLAVLLAACSPGASPGPTGGPGGSPPPVPTGTTTTGAIEHVTGATDLLLRLDEGGGFVPAGYFLTQAPMFSLYGDGTAIFRDPRTTPPPANGTIILSVPFQTVRLTEEQIQSLLAFAIGPGGLGIARARYDNMFVADASTAVFTIVAGGTTKTVSAYALGMDSGQAGPDSIILAQLASLRTRLFGFANDVGGEKTWSPDRYRGILGDDATEPPVDWPWPAIRAADFLMRVGPDAPRFPIRTMTPAEVAVLGLTGIEGGMQGLALRDAAGNIYSFRLRPILPDEQY